jgi:Raf kinase inhibitor-like YbhB/YbcL family protein
MFLRTYTNHSMLFTRRIVSVKSVLIVILLFLFGLTACGGSTPTPMEGASEMSIQITSATFEEGTTIPVKYTCDGEDISPPLAWSGVPEGTQSLVLISDDPDAPVGTWVHWVLFDLPADTNSLPEGVQGMGTDGNNSWRRPGYGGPCPPSGTHRYFFKLYALDSRLDLKEGASKEDVEEAMQGHILAQAQLMGKYGR